MRESSSNASEPDLDRQVAEDPVIQPAATLIIHAIIGEYRAPKKARLQRRNFQIAMYLALGMLVGVLLTPIMRVLHPSHAAQRPVLVALAVVPRTLVTRANRPPVRVKRNGTGKLHYSSKRRPSNAHVAVLRIPPPVSLASPSPVRHATAMPRTISSGIKVAKVARPHHRKQRHLMLHASAMPTPRTTAATLTVFRATPQHVPYGYGTTLCVEAANAVELYVSGIGSLPPAALTCKHVMPVKTVQYTAWVVDGAGHHQQRSLTITVDPPTPDE